MKKRDKKQYKKAKTDLSDTKISGRKRDAVRTALCLLAGAAILAAGLLLPKMIFAGLDRRELGKTYAQKVDQSFLTEQETLSTADKLELLRQTLTNGAITVWKADDGWISDSSDGETVWIDEMYPSLRGDIYSRVHSMQEAHVLPYFEFSAEEFSYNAECGLKGFVNAENLNQYMVVAEFYYAADSGYLSVIADAETGDILSYSAGSYNRTEEETDEILDADVKGYLMRMLSLTSDEFEEYCTASAYDIFCGISKIYNNGGTTSDKGKHAASDSCYVETYLMTEYKNEVSFGKSAEAADVDADTD